MLVTQYELNIAADKEVDRDTLVWRLEIIVRDCLTLKSGAVRVLPLLSFPYSPLFYYTHHYYTLKRAMIISLTPYCDLRFLHVEPSAASFYIYSSMTPISRSNYIYLTRARLIVLGVYLMWAQPETANKRDTPSTCRMFFPSLSMNFPSHSCICASAPLRMLILRLSPCTSPFIPCQPRCMHSSSLSMYFLSLVLSHVFLLYLVLSANNKSNVE